LLFIDHANQFVVLDVDDDEAEVAVIFLLPDTP